MPRLLAALFVLVALPSAAMFAVLVPPGQVADEPGHIARAAALAQGRPLGERRAVATAGRDTLQSGVQVDANLWHVTFVLRHRGNERLDADRLAANRAFPWSGSRIFAETGSIALYLPVFYVPAAIGIGLAEALRIHPYDAVVIGRLCAAACFVALGAAALALARRGSGMLFCALACPMSLSLAASFNQDGLLIAASGLAASLATRPGPRARHGAALLIGCVAAAKLPYLPLLVLLARPPAPPRQWARLMAATALPALAWTAFAFAAIAAPVPRSPYAPGPLWSGDPATRFAGTDALAQLHVLLSDPARLFWLPARTVLHDPWLVRQGIGVLGWLDVKLPEALYHLWMAALAAALLADLLDARAHAARIRDALAAALAVLLALWGIYLSQYLVWTDVGLDRIEGPSGRYLLPLVPLVGLALPCLPLPERWGVRRPVRLLASAVLACAAAAGLAVLPAIVVGAYYLR